MRPVSDRFLASLRTSHLLHSRCDLQFPGDPTPVTVPIEEGRVTCDRTSQVRRAGHVAIPWSLRAGEDLGLDLRTLPLGGYATLWRGVRYSDGSTEDVKLGVLRVESVTWRTPEGSASLELADRMAQVRDEPFTVPLAVVGMRAADAAIAVVQPVFGASVSYAKPNDPPSVMGDTVFTGQRTEALTTLEQAGNGESYFDADGGFVYDVRAGEGDPVWTVDAGQDGVMIEAEESLDRTGVYNGVLVTGQDTATQAPVYGLATDDDPASPTRWGGPFGHVAMLATSQVGTAAEAQANAQSLLGLRLKLTRNLTVTAAPNPALEAGDIIAVVFPDGRTEEHLIDSVTVDLATGAQAIGTRSRFVPGSLTALASPLSIQLDPQRTWERVT
jgi:uncharacterized protein DUF5047